MKKLLALIISLLIGFSPLTYATEIYTDYDFSDEAQEEFDRQREETVMPEINKPIILEQEKHVLKGKKKDIQSEKPTERKNIVLPSVYGTNDQTYNGYIITVPEGSTLDIQLQSGISSGSLDINDSIMASLTQDWKYHNNLIAPAGSYVYGTVTNVTSAGYAYGGAELEIQFNKILTPDGNFYEISTKPVKISTESHRAKNMTRDILVGAGIGILCGLLGFAVSGDNFGKTMAIAGGIGAASGAARGAMQRGQDVSIDADKYIQLILTRPVNVAPYQMF